MAAALLSLPLLCEAVGRAHPALPTSAPAARRRIPTPPAALDVSRLPRLDWSCVDAAFLITCPETDGSNRRVDRAMAMLDAIGLSSRTEVREFARDDEDRVRGCYSSHIAVLEEAARRFPAGEPCNVLVLEDNLSISPRISQDTLNAVDTFIREGTRKGGADEADLLHLAYIMYVPGLSVERLADEEHIVRLRCDADSVLGTTAYIATRRGLDAILAEHARTGFKDAIPNVMARLFPSSRYAAFPMPLHRAATVKSLVNSQLDSLRALIFQPQVYTQWERSLVGTGVSTNVLFPTLVVLVLLGTLAGGGSVASAVAASARGENVNLVFPAIGATIFTFSLGVLGYGLALAPKPPSTVNVAEAAE